MTEDNNTLHGNARYYKSWQNGRMLSASLTHDHNHYKDIYAGTSTGDQRLTTDVTMGLLQLSGSTQKYYYYVSAGLSNSAVSLNGLFTHTLFDPSNKNDMTVPTSFFEAVKGNPDLAPLKVLGNTLSYNGQIGKSKISLSYDNNIYFDNILHQYTADDQTIRWTTAAIVVTLGTTASLTAATSI